MAELLASEMRFPASGGSGSVRGFLHPPDGVASAGPVPPPGRSSGMRNPPVPPVAHAAEWRMIGKPTLFVQGDHDPFCDLVRLREELPRLSVPHDLVVIRDAGHSFEPTGPKRDTFPEVREAVLGWIRRYLG